MSEEMKTELNLDELDAVSGGANCDVSANMVEVQRITVASHGVGANSVVDSVAANGVASQKALASANAAAVNANAAAVKADSQVINVFY